MTSAADADRCRPGSSDGGDGDDAGYGVVSGASAEQPLPASSAASAPSPSPPPPPPLADGTYDVVVMGTGLTECVLSGLLSKRGLRVLHVDRNPYYGGACASLNLTQLYGRFRDTGAISAELGSPRDYNVDLIPKFIMATGTLVKMLVHAGATSYLEFKLVDGSFVFTGDKPHKVPATAMDALRSGLFSLMEKNRCRQFFSFVGAYTPDDPSTHGKRDLATTTMRELFDYWGLHEGTRTLIGHSIALYRSDAYLDEPALPTVLKIKQYANSVARYGNSPYIYPLYGLGELPQAFARLSAVHGGVYMLNTPIERVLFDGATGSVRGVRSASGREAACKFVVGDPSYFPGRTRRIGAVVRCYCILSAPPPHTRDATACQIILPYKCVEPARQHDIYVLVLSHVHRVAASGKYIALVSTTAETERPEEEVRPGLELLGGAENIEEQFVCVDALYEPSDDGRRDGVFVSRSYDATTHFESTTQDIMDLYRRIFDEELFAPGGQ